jgi:hypothetical protein
MEPPTSAELKKTWFYTSTSHTPSWRSASLFKHRDSFTFTIPYKGFKYKQLCIISIIIILVVVVVVVIAIVSIIVPNSIVCGNGRGLYSGRAPLECGPAHQLLLLRSLVGFLGPLENFRIVPLCVSCLHLRKLCHSVKR